MSAFAKPGATLETAYDPYDGLRTTEDLLGLEPLGFAGPAKGFARAALPSAFPKG